MWGVSWANVQLMMADSMRVHYERDNKKQEDEIMDLNNPQMVAKLRQMADAR
jgi:hypothetical protein